MFSADLRDAVARGEITVSIRLWRRPQVKVGGRYRTADVVIEVDAVELLLGHASIEATAIYVHLTHARQGQLPSPLDLLGTEAAERFG